MSHQTLIVLVSNDERLRKKVRALSEKYHYSIPVCTTFDDVMSAFFNAPNHGFDTVKRYVFLDLQTSSVENSFDGFDGYAIAQLLKEQLPDAHLIGSSLGIDPETVQKSKLFGVDTLLQRYRFEELLRKMVAMVEI